jgi:hypothetical protein
MRISRRIGDSDHGKETEPMTKQRTTAPVALREQTAMVWIYWDTFWSLFFSAVWFMTIVSHPDAEIADR